MYRYYCYVLCNYFYIHGYTYGNANRICPMS